MVLTSRRLVAMFLVAPVLGVLPSSPAGAVGETCRGEMATLVGTPGGTVTGTDGDDVIVTGGARSIASRDGDDLVCTTGTARGSGLQVDTGDGDDVVDRSGDARVRAFVRLGGGSDEFAGNAAAEIVVTMGADRVVGGGGGDSVIVSDGEPATGSISLTGKYSEVTLFARPVDLDVQVESGRLGFDAVTGSRPWTVDLAGGQILRGSSVVATLSGFHDLGLQDYDAPGKPGSVTVRGTEADDTVYADSLARLDADLAGGDDSLDIEDCASSVLGEVDGGQGHDLISIGDACGEPLRVDLAEGRIAATRGSSQAADAEHFEDAYVRFALPGMEVVGSEGDNELSVVGCGATVRGGLGDDRLNVFEDSDDFCHERQVSHLYGGSGDDVLHADAHGKTVMRGDEGRDRGRGTERARDVCDTEVRHVCHRP